MTKETYFDKLANELEKLFSKGEKCKCGKRLPCRSKALAFNAWANIYHEDLLKAEHLRGFNEGSELTGRQAEEVNACDKADLVDKMLKEISNYEHDQEAHLKGKCSYSSLALCSAEEQKIKMILRTLIKKQ